MVDESECKLIDGKRCVRYIVIAMITDMVLVAEINTIAVLAAVVVNFGR